MTKCACVLCVFFSLSLFLHCFSCLSAMQIIHFHPLPSFIAPPWVERLFRMLFNGMRYYALSQMSPFIRDMCAQVLHNTATLGEECGNMHCDVWRLDPFSYVMFLPSILSSTLSLTFFSLPPCLLCFSLCICFLCSLVFLSSLFDLAQTRRTAPLAINWVDFVSRLALSSVQMYGVMPGAPLVRYELA